MITRSRRELERLEDRDLREDLGVQLQRLRGAPGAKRAKAKTRPKAKPRDNGERANGKEPPTLRWRKWGDVLCLSFLFLFWFLFVGGGTS